MFNGSTGHSRVSRSRHCILLKHRQECLCHTILPGCGMLVLGRASVAQTLLSVLVRLGTTEKFNAYLNFLFSLSRDIASTRVNVGASTSRCFSTSDAIPDFANASIAVISSSLNVA